MTVNPSIDLARLLEEQLAQASPDLLRELLTTFVNTLMSAEADAVCGAGYGQASPERTNRRNGYRPREFDTRAGTLDLAVPKLRQGTTSPSGCWSAASAPSGRSPRWWRPATCSGVDPADGQAGAVPGHHQPVEVPGQRDGHRARRPR
jgi:hypothetical protein